MTSLEEIAVEENDQKGEKETETWNKSEYKYMSGSASSNSSSSTNEFLEIKRFLDF